MEEDHEYGYETKTGEFYGLSVYFEEKQEEEIERRKLEGEEQAENKLNALKSKWGIK